MASIRYFWTPVGNKNFHRSRCFSVKDNLLNQCCPKLNGSPYHLYRTSTSKKKLKLVYVRSPREIDYTGVTIVNSAANGHHPDFVTAMVMLLL